MVENRIEELRADAVELGCGCLQTHRTKIYIGRRPKSVGNVVSGAQKGHTSVHECGDACELDTTIGSCLVSEHYEVLTLSEYASYRHREGSLASPAEYARQKGQRFAPVAKLTDAEQAEIRALRARRVPVQELADKYGVDSSTISRLVRGLTWQ